MFGEKIIKYCPCCKKDVVINISSKAVNKKTGEVYYNNLICPNCGANLGNKHKDGKDCVTILL